MDVNFIIYMFFVFIFAWFVSGILMRKVYVGALQKFIPVEGEITIKDGIEYFNGGYVSCLNGECLVGFDNGDIAWIKPDDGGILVIADDKNVLDKINIRWVEK